MIKMEATTWLEKVVGNGSVGVVLKEISLEVHGGELMAILGSKGSGKKTLLDVMARRAQGPTRGQITLNGVPMSMRLFQDSCAYVSRQCRLLEGLTTKQTLHYASQLTIGCKVSNYVKITRVKQVMADLALAHVANRGVDQLNPSEYRRLVIGTHLLRDPVVILLDEPTWDLDPLHTYMVVSILSNHAKKYNRIVVMSTEKPRSDIFPFLDRVTYLCMGDIIYTGATRMMLDYFRHLGFPCPELENPLMFYLCLSTIDRRSQARYFESSNQITALVEKFRMEGRPFRKCVVSYASENLETEHRLPLTAYGRPSSGQILTTLIRREWTTVWRCSATGWSQLFMRVFLLPLFFFLLWVFYFQLDANQQSYASRNGLLYNCLAGCTFLSVATTTAVHPALRTRYYQESRDGLYYGPLFVSARNLSSIPLSIVSVLAATAIIFFGLPISMDLFQWFLMAASLWAVYYFMEQQTIALLMVIKSSFTAALVSIFLGIVYLNLGSGMTRAIPGLPDWLYYLSYITQSRYAGAVLNEQHFKNISSSLPTLINSTLSLPCPAGTTFSNYGCRYANGTHYLMERYHINHPPYDDDLKFWLNFGLNFLFTGAMFFANIILHIVPLPAFVKTKFRG